MGAESAMRSYIFSISVPPLWASTSGAACCCTGDTGQGDEFATGWANARAGAPCCEASGVNTLPSSLEPSPVESRGKPEDETLTLLASLIGLSCCGCRSDGICWTVRGWVAAAQSAGESR